MRNPARAAASSVTSARPLTQIRGAVCGFSSAAWPTTNSAQAGLTFNCLVWIDKLESSSTGDKSLSHATVTQAPNGCSPETVARLAAFAPRSNTAAGS